VAHSQARHSATGLGSLRRRRTAPLLAHGLRKAAARRLPEAGCMHEIAAIAGDATLRERGQYTKAADQKRLAVAAIDLAEGLTIWPKMPAKSKRQNG
jgi:hypothetical protein